MNSFGALSSLTVGGREYEIYRPAAVPGLANLPFSLKILAENLLRNEDGVNVTAAQIAALAAWDPQAEPSVEAQFTPARVLLQDFTGVPCVVDLAAMRDAVRDLGGDSSVINPQVPAELVIDHSVQIDQFGQPGALAFNVAREYQRNGERYQFLRWGQGAFANFAVVPPGTGIVHQVNIEYLARVVCAVKNDDDGKPLAYPDTLVGTDSHTTMVNGLGVLGWGVGGIEAEAAMLGQPLPMLIPKVVGFKLSGDIPAGVTATDVVLTITQMLRAHGVVGKFVEFYGAGVARVPLANRATIGNMSPEFGSTAAIFPIDTETIRYLQLTGRKPEQVALVEAYAKAQGLWHDPAAPDYQEPAFSEYLELDLGSVVPSIAGPKRPQDRVPLAGSKAAFAKALQDYLPDAAARVPAVQEGDEESFPASDPLAVDGQVDPVVGDAGLVPEPGPVKTVASDASYAGQQRSGVRDGDVVIASITSCTNTSNPSVMLAAGLLARNAVAKGLSVKSWVKTSLAPGSKVVTEYLEQAGLWPALNTLGFNLVGYGCATCIGNSGPLIPAVESAIREHNLVGVSVLSGNRNFEGRINPDVKMNYLASPPLVVAYAIAGTMDFDFATEPLGVGSDGQQVYLQDIWPSPAEIEAAVAAAITPEMFVRDYGQVFDGDERWRALGVPQGESFSWDADSTYVRRPPYFDGLQADPAPVADIADAAVLVMLGDSVTTDHISPAGAIKADSPAGRYLEAHGVTPANFNSYGSRRGNHEVMIRGTFANIRIRNQLLAAENDGRGVEGGFTKHLPTGQVIPIYDAAQAYAASDTPLVVLAGKEYGSGSSRDWAAKGTALLGVRAVIAESFERIHRSNLVGMGVLPLQYQPGDSAEALGLTGTERFDITGIAAINDGATPPAVTVRATKPGSDPIEFTAQVRIDTAREADYYRNGGILPYVLRQLLRETSD